LSKAKDDIARLEDRIRCEQDERINTEGKMREVNSDHANASAPDDDFLPSSDTNALKQKIHSLLTRQADLSTELDKTNAKLELERKTWIAEEQNSYKELSIYKAKLLVLQNVLIERDFVVAKWRQSKFDRRKAYVGPRRNYLGAEERTPVKGKED